MNRAQSNFFNMGKSVYDLFYNSSMWQDIPLLASSVEKVGKLCMRIGDEVVKQQKNNTMGYTATKERERTLLEDRLFRVATCVKLFALTEDDNVLLQQVSFSRTFIDNLALNSLLATARAVADSASENLEDLEPFKVTQEDINELQDSIAATEEINAHRDTVQSEHTENTAHLKLLISALRKELNVMDVQVKVFITDEEFLRTYFIARRVHSVRGGGSISVKKDGE